LTRRTLKDITSKLASSISHCNVIPKHGTENIIPIFESFRRSVTKGLGEAKQSLPSINLAPLSFRNYFFILLYLLYFCSPQTYICLTMAYFLVAALSFRIAVCETHPHYAMTLSVQNLCTHRTTITS